MERNLIAPKAIQPSYGDHAMATRRAAGKALDAFMAVKTEIDAMLERLGMG